jgi:hypothetical protein
MVLDLSWNGVALAIAVFPESSLPELAAIALQYKMTLLGGTPYTVVDGTVLRYRVNTVLRNRLGLEVGDRTYVIQLSPDQSVPNKATAAR